MKVISISFSICLAISTLSMAVGYGLAGQQIGAGVSLLIALGWLAGFKYRASYLVYFCMFGVVCLATAGLIIGITYWLMIAGLSFALAAWDIVLLRISFFQNQSNSNTRAFENKHLQSLGIAIGIGLACSIPFHLVTFQLPFIVMLGLIVLAGLGIERVWIYLRKRQTRVP
jgi:DMSO reductase anchor subunit